MADKAPQKGDQTLAFDSKGGEKSERNAEKEMWFSEKENGTIKKNRLVHDPHPRKKTTLPVVQPKRREKGENTGKGGLKSK